jgi:hypothetical protein
MLQVLEKSALRERDEVTKDSGHEIRKDEMGWPLGT